MKSIALILLLSPLGLLAQNVGIGTTTPDASAKLEVQSTTGGVLVPRLTTVERDAISLPATGLLVFNATMNQFEFYNGTSWTPIASASSGGNEISDADGDSKVEVEQNADEDIIRFTVGGNEIARFIDNRLEMLGTGFSVFIGHNSGASDNGAGNYITAVGNRAGENQTSGSFNTFLGASAGNANQTGDENTYVGTSSGYKNISNGNTMIGRRAGFENVNGSSNTFLGNHSGHNNTGSGNVFLGHYAGQNETGSNKLMIDNSNTTTPLVFGDFDQDKIFINRSNGITLSEVFGFRKNISGSEYGGMYAETSGSTSGRPFYGFAINGVSKSWLYHDGASDEMRFFNNGEKFSIGDSTTISTNLAVNGRLFINNMYAFPLSDGSAGQVLQSDGAGEVTWAMPGGVFEETNGVIRQKSGYNDDFIFGRDTFPANGELVTDDFFFFDKSKAAFRGGKLSTSFNWMPDSVGLNSFGFGHDPLASGSASVALGSHSEALGDYSFASGYYSQAFGNESIALGYYANAYGSKSLAIGNSTYTEGDNSIAMGKYTSAIGENSFAAGQSAKSSGMTSVATGNEVEAYSFAETTMGTYNTAYNPASISTWQGEDRLFVLGNGIDNITRSDAMVVLKNGNTAFPDGDLIVGRDVAPANGEIVTDDFFFFDKSKAAFRGGKLSTSFNWMPDSVGLNSFGFGHDPLASGSASVALGSHSEALGDYSFASGYYSQAFGNESIALGHYANAYGNKSLAIGNGTYAEGDNSIALGKYTSAIGENSFAVGESAKSSGMTSIALGNLIEAYSFAETAIGTFNSTYSPTSTTSWHGEDRLFVLGNGIDNLTRSDAMVVLKNGNVGIGTSSPTYLLELDSDSAAKPGSDVWTVTSDERLKQNINPYKDGLDQIMKIKPVNYNYNDLSGHDVSQNYVGVIAQELKTVAPYMVKQKRDGYYAVDAAAMKYMLINAVQEQQEIIKQMKDDKEKSDARISALEKKLETILNGTIKLNISQ